jgi:hypothetical protein
MLLVRGMLFALAALQSSACMTNWCGKVDGQVRLRASCGPHTFVDERSDPTPFTGRAGTHIHKLLSDSPSLRPGSKKDLQRPTAEAFEMLAGHTLSFKVHRRPAAGRQGSLSFTTVPESFWIG